MIFYLTYPFFIFQVPEFTTLIFLVINKCIVVYNEFGFNSFCVTFLFIIF